MKRPNYILTKWKKEDIKLFLQFVWAGENQGRVASLPAALVPHLAERREKAAMVVEVRPEAPLLYSLHQ